MEEHPELKKALDAWIAGRAAPGEHPAVEELYEFFIRPAGHPQAGQLLAHLCRCPACMRKFQELARSIPEAEQLAGWWDVALPKAAAAHEQGPMRITTEGGKYTIEIRPQLADKSRGLITVQPAPQHQQALEGAAIVLRDSKGRVLLEGRIVSSEVSQLIEDLDKIEYGLIVQAH